MSGAVQALIGSLRAGDPNWSNVALLLPGNGTNGAQNNTFIDSSANNFTITRSGNTTQGTFTPFGSNWSNYFDGNGDFLTSPASTNVDLTSGDFTIEFWINAAVVTGGSIITKDGVFGSTYNQYAIVITAASKINAGVGNGTSGSPANFQSITGATTLVRNTWYHVAFVKNGTTLTIYLNGVSDASATQTVTMVSGGRAVYIGYDAGQPASAYFNGYISNLRIVKGTAVYTSAFTPPTSPLTAITNTSLLTCQSNRFVDNSTNAFTITRNGDVSVQRFSPFRPSAAYAAADIGGSGYFDGTGDYLSIADAATIRFGTGNFTIQAWVYRAVAGATQTIAAKGGASTGWVFQITSTNVLRFTDTTTNIDTTTTIPASTWAHVAVVRSGTGANQLKLYINGVDSATGTSATNFNQTEQLNIGADRGNANTMNGYISNLKYNVGTAEAIIVPASPVTGGTALLNFTNAGIIDNAMLNDLETVGNAQISTAQSKFGGSSMAFDGTDDRLVTAASPNNALGSGDFTVEAWVWSADVSSASQRGWIQTSDVAGGLKTTSTVGIWIHFGATSNGTVSANVGGTAYTSAASTVAVNTWYHIALTRASGVVTIWVNGTSVASGSGNTTNLTGQNLVVGGYYSTAFLLNGYIDDLRITKGVARYTANFTPPAAAFPTS